jgi:hypothetical protein
MNRTYNTQPLVAKMEDVIKNGLDQILKEFMERYELLEKTHTQIMNLPSVRNELNLNPNINAVEPNINIVESSVQDKTDIKDLVHALVHNELSRVEQKMECLAQDCGEAFSLLHKIMHNMENLNKEMHTLKNEKNVVNLEKLVEPIIKPSIVSACENENIQFDIKEEEPDIDIVEVKKEKPNAIEITEYEESEEELDLVEEEEVVQEEEEEELVQEEDDEEVVEDVEDTEDEVEVEVECNEDKVKEDDVETETESETSNEDEEETKEQEQEEEEDEEIFEIEIDETTYCTNNDENGFIYQLNDGEVGDKVGYFKESEPFFYADEN